MFLSSNSILNFSTIVSFNKYKPYHPKSQKTSELWSREQTLLLERLWLELDQLIKNKDPCSVLLIWAELHIITKTGILNIQSLINPIFIQMNEYAHR